MNKSIEAIKDCIAPILKEAGVKRSALFGSCARGSAEDSSDVDILVELPEYMSLFDYINLKHKLEDAVGRAVDLVEYRSIKPRLRTSILADQVEVL